MIHGIAASLLALAAGAAPAAAPLEVFLPSGRTAFQTNEFIHLGVLRQGTEELPAEDLELKLAGEDGSRIDLAFAVGPAPAAGGKAASVEHVYLNGRLLRPGRYTVEARAGGASARTEIDLFSHVRKSSFRLITWARAKGDQKLHEGEDGMGYNLAYSVYTDNTSDDGWIRAGVDHMKCCTLGGGHQLNFRPDDDWSDPYVLQGGLARASRQALRDRTRPNTLGVHLFDEPGLTWRPDPETGQNTPHTVAPQHRAHRSAFGEDPIGYRDVDPNDTDDVARWMRFARFKLAFLPAAWAICRYGVENVEPGFLTANQSQYGVGAFGDGYYFNVARPLPVVSGHGGYHDWGPGYWHPSLTLETARARDLAKPCWYLPTWYGSTTSEHMRLEQYLSFQTNIQGLETPPDLDPYDPARREATEGLVESNKLMARLGTVFTTMGVTRPPVAILNSLSDNLRRQCRDMTFNYNWFEGQYSYLAGKLLQHQFTYVVEEDALDGTLSANHKALVLESVDYLPPEVIAALEAFIDAGGLVMKTSDSKVEVRGAVDLGVVADAGRLERRNQLFERVQAIRAKEQPPRKRDGELAREARELDRKLQDVKLSDDDRRPLDGRRREIDAERARLADQLQVIGQELAPAMAEYQEFTSMRATLRVAQEFAEAIRPHLERAGIRPPLASTEPGISVTRQTAGDVEYLLAVNATHDFQGENPQLALKATTATLSLPAGDRPVYDAVHGGPAAGFDRQGDRLVGTSRFGPGQMRVFARTARPVGGVRAMTPVVRRDYTRQKLPLSVELAACVVDGSGGGLSGSIPLRIRLIDPLGEVRYDLYRATRDGVLQIELSLAANDAAGEWTFEVRELLANTAGRAAFTLPQVGQCGAVAGLVERAVCFPGDRDHVFRFFRTYEDVTVVPGSGDYAAEIERLKTILAPWDVRLTVLPADQAAKPRTLSETEAEHWCGLQMAKAEPGGGNSPVVVGFDVRGPVILLGTPEDNPLIAFALREGFLPYKPDAARMPGPRRGLVTWQRDAVGYQQESIALVAYDKQGMAEAIGTMYEAAAGIEPLTPWRLPKTSRVRQADRGTSPPGFEVVFSALLPDRAVGIKPAGDRMELLTWDRSLCVLSADGRLAPPQVLSDDAYATRLEAMKPASDPDADAIARKVVDPRRMLKYAVGHDGQVGAGYWGGGLRILGNDGSVRAFEQTEADIAGLGWLGDVLVVALSDGRVIGVKGP